MKTVVTHLTPDLDAITSVWLIKRFLTNWSDASVAFVASGETLKGMAPDSDPNILHVDTGLGFLDHHQTNEETCAAQRVLNHLKEKKVLLKHPDIGWEVLERLVAFVVSTDHFKEVHYPDPTADLYVFMATSILDGWKRLHFGDDHKILELGFDMLDAIHKSFQDRVWAERELEKRQEFGSPWGKALGIETNNDEVVKLALKMGYQLVARKDPQKKYVRIKGIPGGAVDLENAYKILKEKDPEATWFLHVSHKMLLNGTTHNPDMKPTSLSLDEIIEILRK